MTVEDSLRAVMLTSLDPMVAIDNEGIIRIASESVREVFGWSADELEGQNVRVLMPEPYHSEHDQYLANYRETSKTRILGNKRIFQAVRRNGEVFPCEINVTRLGGTGGASEWFVGIIRDLTQQKRTEAVLWATQQRQSAVMAASLDPMITIDSHGIVQAASDSIKRVFDWDPGEVIGQNINMLMPEPYRSQHDGFLERYRKTGDSRILGMTREFQAMRRDGAIFPCEINVARVDVPGQDEPWFTGTIRDVTDRKRTEASLWATQKRQAAVMAASLDPMVTINAHGIIQSASDSVERVFGWKSEEIIRKNVKILMAEPHQSRHDQYLRQYRATGKTSILGNAREFVAVRKDGSEFPCEINVPRVDIPGQDDPWFTGIIRDLTAAKESDRVKSDFLANMSHEIRTPLTAIRGYTEEIAESLDDARSVEITERIRHNCARLQAVMDDMLSVAQVDGGTIECNVTSCNPRKVLKDNLVGFEEAIRKKGLSLKVAISDDVPDLVNSDPELIGRILSHVVGNAVKFTDEGGIEIELRQEPSNALIIEVSDTGVGIPKDRFDHVFRRFTQVDTSRTRKYEGAGLGLSISHALAKRLGGDLTIVRSAPGEGSLFRLSLPSLVSESDQPGGKSEAAGRKKQGAPSSSPLANIKALIVDDGPDNQRLVSFILKKAGANVEVAANGKLGLEVFAAAEGQGTPFDVVLMDMQMPVMDGYTATRTLREQGQTLPIIALTAHTGEEERKACLDAGCTEFMNKPCDRNALIEIVKSLVGEGAQLVDQVT